MTPSDARLGRVALALTLALPAVAQANDAVISYAGGTPQVVDIDDARMAAESLVFTYTDHMRWEASLTYTLENQGDARTLDIGLPFHLPRDDGGDIQILGETATTLDGAPVEVTTHLQDDHPELGFSRIDAVEVPFDAGQSRTLVHTYDALPGISADGVAWFEYILTTGAHWDGPIGSVEIRFQLPDDAPCVAASLPSRIEDGWLIVELEDWEATHDFAVIWARDQAMREALALPWEDREWTESPDRACHDGSRRADLAFAYYGLGVPRSGTPGPEGLATRVIGRFGVAWASLPMVEPERVCDTVMAPFEEHFFSYAVVPDALVRHAGAFGGVGVALPASAIECLTQRLANE